MIDESSRGQENQLSTLDKTGVCPWRFWELCLLKYEYTAERWAAVNV